MRARHPAVSQRLSSARRLGVSRGFATGVTARSIPGAKTHMTDCTTTAASFDRRNPVTGAVASTAIAFTVRDAVAAADAAALALTAWSALGPNARRAALTLAADKMAARGDAFVDAMMSEVGATEGWARFNLKLAVDMVREAAALTTQIGGEVIPSDKPGCLALAIREPAGVGVGVEPWNE